MQTLFVAWGFLDHFCGPLHAWRWLRHHRMICFLLDVWGSLLRQRDTFVQLTLCLWVLYFLCLQAQCVIEVWVPSPHCLLSRSKLLKDKAAYSPSHYITIASKICFYILLICNQNYTRKYLQVESYPTHREHQGSWILLHFASGTWPFHERPKGNHPNIVPTYVHY